MEKARKKNIGVGEGWRMSREKYYDRDGDGEKEGGGNRKSMG